MYTRQQKYTNNDNRQKEKQGGIDSIETSFDFSHFLSWNSTLFRINATLQHFKESLDIFLPQIERKRPKE